MTNSVELSTSSIDQTAMRPSGATPRRDSVASAQRESLVSVSEQSAEYSGDAKRFETSARSNVELSDQIRRLGNVKLAISIDETANQPVIRIFDQESGNEMIQIPAEYSLTISQTIQTIAGALFDKKV
jgi:uncharacterized FlaG/YvyC family protein